jgi:hypothetical protein
VSDDDHFLLHGGKRRRRRALYINLYPSYIRRKEEEEKNLLYVEGGKCISRLSSITFPPLYASSSGPFKTKKKNQTESLRRLTRGRASVIPSSLSLSLLSLVHDQMYREGKNKYQIIFDFQQLIVRHYEILSRWIESHQEFRFFSHKLRSSHVTCVYNQRLHHIDSWVPPTRIHGTSSQSPTDWNPIFFPLFYLLFLHSKKSEIQRPTLPISSHDVPFFLKGRWYTQTLVSVTFVSR